MKSEILKLRVQLLSTRQAAELLGISTRSLWTLTHEGKLPHLRVGKLVKYPMDRLEQWVRENTDDP